jgi:hypothetical protein
MNRPIYVIASEVRSDWKKVSPYALPYLEAMFTLGDIRERFYEDSGKSVVMYFLANAGSWRGEVARRVKKELNAMLNS